jgi:hypothetical protein
MTFISSIILRHTAPVFKVQQEFQNYNHVEDTEVSGLDVGEEAPRIDD